MMEGGVYDGQLYVGKGGDGDDEEVEGSEGVKNMS